MINTSTVETVETEGNKKKWKQKSNAMEKALLNSW